MTIHEFGKENTKTVVLLHPAAVMWDFFQDVIPLLETEYHLVVPAFPGYDTEVKSDYTSVEEIVTELMDWLYANAKRNKVIGLIGMIVLSIVITCGVNKQYTFGAGFIQSYIFFNAFSLFDALVIDSI